MLFQDPVPPVLPDGSPPWLVTVLTLLAAAPFVMGLLGSGLHLLPNDMATKISVWLRRFGYDFVGAWLAFKSAPPPAPPAPPAPPNANGPAGGSPDKPKATETLQRAIAAEPYRGLSLSEPREQSRLLGVLAARPRPATRYGWTGARQAAFAAVGLWLVVFGGYLLSGCALFQAAAQSVSQWIQSEQGTVTTVEQVADGVVTGATAAFEAIKPALPAADQAKAQADWDAALATYAHAKQTLNDVLAAAADATSPAPDLGAAINAVIDAVNQIVQIPKAWAAPSPSHPAASLGDTAARALADAESAAAKLNARWRTPSGAKGARR